MGDLKLNLVETFQDVEEFFRWLSMPRDWLGLDTETEGLILHKERVRMVQFGDTQEAWAIPFNRWGGICQDVFDKYTGNYVLHNAKFDMGRLQEEGIRLPSWRQVHDTYVMSFLHDNQEPNRKLKRLAKKYVGVDADTGERQLHQYMRQSGHTWATIPLDHPLYWEYAALDPVLTVALAEKLWPQASQYQLAYDLEMAAVKVLMKMEINGLSVDLEYAKPLLESMVEERSKLVVTELENGIMQDRLTNEGFRPNYTEDILRYFTENGVVVPVKRSKKTGKISIDDSVLAKIDHPVARKIQRVRHLKSWVDNYLQKLVDNEFNGKVHPHINPLGGDDKGRTGRMSITDPALSVLEKSALIRDCIVAGEGQAFLSVDYENEELRVIGSICNSPGMIEAFRQGIDMHKQTAAKMYGISMEEVTPQQKTNAKRAMFTKAYGGREATFAAYMGLTYEEGARYYQTLSTLYPELDEYIEHQKQTIKMNKVDGFGHIFLSDGRRLNIPANLSFTAVSYSSQGEASIVLKKKLVQLDAAGLSPYLRLPIHDEVLFEVPVDEFEEIRKEAMNILTCNDFTIPLTVDAEGPWAKWGDQYRNSEEDDDE